MLCCPHLFANMLDDVAFAVPMLLVFIVETNNFIN